jgi:uncharacterized cupin superfamily protein
MSKAIGDVVFFEQSKPEAERYHLAAEKLVTGNPEQAVWNHYSDPGSQFHVGVWSSEVGCWRIRYTEYEFCQILEGVSILRDSQGAERTQKPGDNFVIPAGFEGEWEVTEPCKKIYVIFEPDSNA